MPETRSMKPSAQPSSTNRSRRHLVLGGSLAAAVTGVGLLPTRADAATGTTAWVLGGNTGVNTDGTNFLGTKNVAPLIFKTAASSGSPLERMRIGTDGKIGVGATAPTATLDARSADATAIRGMGGTANGCGVRGTHASTLGTTAGVLGDTTSTAANAVGVMGLVSSTSSGSSSAGVRGVNKGTSGSGIGVYGTQDGGGYGVYGSTPSGYGVYGSGSVGVYGTGSYGLFGSGGTYGVYGSGTYGLYGSGTYGVFGSGTYGAYGSGSSYGLYGSSSGGFGVRGDSTSAVGVAGNSSSSNALQGVSTNGPGIFAQSTNSSGVDGRSTGGNGVQGISSSGTGVLGQSSTGYAGYFFGNVGITGNLSKASGSFVIDHPLEPATKTLTHSFVESDEMKNIYDGVAVVGADGLAKIRLPRWFEALNKDLRYQLTSIGRAETWVERELEGGTFVIGSSVPGGKVCWQVTGVRQDAWANTHRLPVESDKPRPQRGKYLHPELFGHGHEHAIPASLVATGSVVEKHVASPKAHQARLPGEAVHGG